MMIGKILLAYILGYVILGWMLARIAPFIELLLSLPLAPIARRIQAIAPVISFLTSAVSSSLMAVLFLNICGWLRVQPTFLMFFLPYTAIMSNNWKRIDAAKQGKSLTGLLEAMEEQEISLDLKDEKVIKSRIKNEYGYLIGDALGIWIPPILMLNRFPIF